MVNTLKNCTTGTGLPHRCMDTDLGTQPVQDELNSRVDHVSKPYDNVGKSLQTRKITHKRPRIYGPCILPLTSLCSHVFSEVLAVRSKLLENRENQIDQTGA